MPKIENYWTLVRHHSKTLVRGLAKGCQTHGCFIKRPKGMAVNGRCQCPDYVEGYLVQVITDLFKQEDILSQ